jgi:hypothetical protein
MPFIIRFWILFSALLVGAGWILSAVHELNRTGYAIVFAIAAAALFRFRKKIDWPTREIFRRNRHSFRQRIKHSAPLIFSVLTLLALVAGALYFPSNKDSVGYRIPRVLHWLAQGQWHWIHTEDPRINIAGCGFEWLTAPLILFTHTDRFLFLINWISFLMLPGLIFSVFTRLGVCARVAWWWMWLLPSGWCFILQASSTINDSFAAVYALAALDFALRARAEKNCGDLWLSMLAAALLTGVKQTVIPLALPWLIAFWPSAKRLSKQRLVSLGVAAVCLLISGGPMIFFDWQHTGNWMGIAENSRMWENTQLHSPFWGIIGNTFCLAAQNFKPPFFPWFNTWNEAMRSFSHTTFGAHFSQFEFFGRLSLGEGEANAGIGSGICLLILVSLWVAQRYRTVPPICVTDNSDRLIRILRWVPWLLLVVFMAKIGTFENARQLAPYYIFLFPSLLIGRGQAVLTRRRWWRCFAILIMGFTVFLLVISRDRPLFPSQFVITRLETKHPGSTFIASLAHSYSGTADFQNQRFFLRTNLPPDETLIGYATFQGMSEPAMWFSSGQPQVERVLAGDTPEQLRLEGMHYVVLEDSLFRRNNDTLPQWLARYDGTVLKEWTFLSDPYAPRAHFWLVRLGSASEQNR